MVFELPPPTQGVVALEALSLLQGLEPNLKNKIRCARLALEDGARYVRDGADVSFLLSDSFLDARRLASESYTTEPAGGTVYLCAVDQDRMAVSFIQSLYYGFGSKIVVPETGIILHNRGACFAVGGKIEPGRRPYHTLVPGLLTRGGSLYGPFGVMGGFIQAQAHMQLVSALVDDRLDPQTALDRPRFRVEGDSVLLERGLWRSAEELARQGCRVVMEPDIDKFGGGQAILVERGTLIGGSDSRKDGYAAGY